MCNLIDMFHENIVELGNFTRFPFFIVFTKKICLSSELTRETVFSRAHEYLCTGSTETQKHLSTEAGGISSTRACWTRTHSRNIADLLTEKTCSRRIEESFFALILICSKIIVVLKRQQGVVENLWRNSTSWQTKYRCFRLIHVLINPE